MDKSYLIATVPHGHNVLVSDAITGDVLVVFNGALYVFVTGAMFSSFENTLIKRFTFCLLEKLI